MRTPTLEYRVEPDRDLMSGRDVARIIYRRVGVRTWSKCVVILEGDTTLADVERMAPTIIARYEERP